MAMLHPFDPKVNQPRPNSDGTVSTELTRTVHFPDGSWVNVPSLWWGNGSDVRDLGQMDDDQLAGLAVRFEAQSGYAFPRFNSLAEAETSAKNRSAAGGGENGAIASGGKKPVTLEQLAEGIRRAHAAGNAEHVRALGQAYRQMQAQGQPQPEAVPSPYDSGNAVRLTGGPGVATPPMRNDLMTSAAATVGGIVNGIPVLGPLAQNATDNIMGIGAQLTGGDYGQTVQGLRDRRAQIARAAPVASLSGELAGSIGALGAFATVPAAAEALGITGTKFLPRVVNSAASGSAIAGADATARGQDAVTAVLLGAGAGGAVPAIGAGINLGAKAIGNRFAPIVNAMLDADREGARRLGMAATRDAVNSPTSVMRPSDESVAALNGLPIINADRGGETVRALTRSVANQNPEARGIIERTVSDRFSGQASRAAEFVRRLAGGNVDDIGYQQAIRETAQRVNEPLYRRAFEAPEAQEVWSREIWELMQSDTFRAAVKSAERRGTDKAAVSGFEAVRNPFNFLDDGSVTFKEGVAPTLAFWDQVKRNIDGFIGQQTGPNADRTILADLTAMKRKLVGALDELVPQYRDARASAASYFGAEDALDAGKMFANKTRQLPEARRAFSALSEGEKDAFRTGFASEIIDKIKDARFRANVIDQAFGSPAKREMIELVFGPQKARQLEAYVRVEELADKLRGALGNSTTARQLVELGLGAGGGAVLSGGDWRGALGGAALVKGARVLGERADAKAMQEVARLLTSSNPDDLMRAVNTAAENPAWMDVLEGLDQLVAVGARGAAVPMAVGQN